MDTAAHVYFSSVIFRGKCGVCWWEVAENELPKSAWTCNIFQLWPLISLAATILCLPLSETSSLMSILRRGLWALGNIHWRWWGDFNECSAAEALAQQWLLKNLSQGSCSKSGARPDFVHLRCQLRGMLFHVNFLLHFTRSKCPLCGCWELEMNLGAHQKSGGWEHFVGEGWWMKIPVEWGDTKKKAIPACTLARTRAEREREGGRIHFYRVHQDADPYLWCCSGGFYAALTACAATQQKTACTAQTSHLIPSRASGELTTWKSLQCDSWIENFSLPPTLFSSIITKTPQKSWAVGPGFKGSCILVVVPGNPQRSHLNSQNQWGCSGVMVVSVRPLGTYTPAQSWLQVCPTARDLPHSEFIPLPAS